MSISASSPAGPRTETKRVSTGSVAGAGGTASVTVTWDVPFADANYTVAASVERDIVGDDLRIQRIRSQTATACVVAVVNNSLTAQTGTLHAIAIAD